MKSFFEIQESSEFQRTIKNQTQVSGTAFRWFSGKSTVHFYPSQEQGIRFKIGSEMVLVSPAHVTFDERHCTTLKTETVSIYETEHILSAVYGLGITNLIIEFEGVSEPPIMDGSAKTFVDALISAQIVDLQDKKKEFVITSNYHFTIPDSDSFIEVSPSLDFKIQMNVNYPTPIGKQELLLDMTPDTYIKEISFARAPLRCPIENTTQEQIKEWFIGYEENKNSIILYSQKQYITPLRVEDEVVRHKALDFVGDLANIGFPVRGTFRCYKVGHKINGEFVKLFKL